MGNEINTPEDLDHEGTARLILDFFHRIMMHHTMWFLEVQHQLGPEKAQEILKTAYERSYGIQMNRLANSLGFEMQNDIPSPMLALSKEELSTLRENVAINWLANDGTWFQAVENSHGMTLAKKLNDKAW